MFRFKLIANGGENTAGVVLRFFGVDIALLFLGFVSDWRIIDLRAPVNNGVYLQVWFIIFSIGRYSSESIYEK